MVNSFRSLDLPGFPGTRSVSALYRPAIIGMTPRQQQGNLSHGSESLSNGPMVAIRSPILGRLRFHLRLEIDLLPLRLSKRH
jgi:hypothetical protein